MHGIVSLLDDQHSEFVEKLWVEMGQRFGVGKPAATFVPHFSYHVAEDYEIERVKETLEEVARETAVFLIRAEGIAIFPSAMNIIYIPIACSLVLTQLHERVWTAVTPYSQGSLAYYAPSVWFPHITLVHASITPDDLGPIVVWLHAQSITWTIPVDNLALISDENGRHKERLRFTFPS